MQRRLPIGRMFGVEIQVDWAWIVAFVLVAGSLAPTNRRLLPNVSVFTLTVASFLAAAGLFASLGAHELIRTVASRRPRVTMFVLGSDVESATPRSEIDAAVAALFASIVTAAVIVLAIGIGTAPLPASIDDLNRMGAPGVVLLEIAAANAAIAVINLLPAFPLDGGRIFRALLWRSTGDLDRATKYSAWAGQAVGWGLVVLGIALAVAVHPLGAWACAIGWFVASASAQAYAVSARSAKSARAARSAA